MQLIDAIVRNPVKVTVGVLLVALFGVVALTSMPMQLTPEVQTPTITVETRWPGASPQEVEQQIILEQESQLKSVEGLTKLTSESADSKGTITLEFNVGTNVKAAIVDVINRLEQVPVYPEDADKPVLSTSNASDRPIAWFILSARYPTAEEIAAFQQQHPELAEQLESVRRAHNVGLAMLRLRNLAAEHPEVRELLPPQGIDVPKLKRFAEDEIEARFERVPGVSQSNVLGGLEDELQVIVDPEKLAARQLTIADVRTVLRGQNKDTSGGDFWEGKRRWVVRTLGQFRTPEQVENQLLAVRDGAPVYVRDVATVELGYKKPDGLVRRFGESSIALNCLRATGANVLDVMDGLRQVRQELDEGLLKDRGLQLTQVYDETDYIYSSIDLVQQNIFIGGALTMIVLMAFLHLGVRTLVAIPLIFASALAAANVSPWFFAVCLAMIVGCGLWYARGALVVGLAIPTSIIGTFLILSMLGRSLNVISLAGMAFAVGMLVDNAVVVLENIYRRHSLGEAPFTAAVRGTQEVWGAVVSSTLTTVAVFLPIVFIQEEAGQLFRDIALAISAAVALSLVVSMTLIPMASARLLGRHRSPAHVPTGERWLGHQPEGLVRHWSAAGNVDDNGNGAASPTAPLPGGEGSQRRYASTFLQRCSAYILWPINAFAGGFVAAVVGLNAWLQRGVIRRLAVVAALLGTAFLCLQLVPKVEYLPTGNRNLVFGILLPPPGYNLDKLMELGEQVERDLKPYWDVDPGSPQAKELKFPVIGDFFFVARGRQVFMGLRAHDPMRVAELVPLVQQVGMKLPGTFAVAKQSSLFEQGLSKGRTIDIEITGPELTNLVALGGQIMGQVRQIMPDAQARPVPSLDLSSPEIHIEPKLVQAAEMGISSADLGYIADALVDGAYAGDYYIGGDKIDLTIKGEDVYADSTQKVEALPVATPIGQLVPLGALADVRLSSGPEQVNHRERLRAITIEVSPQEKVAIEDAMLQIREQIVQPMYERGQLDGGYRIMLAGTADKLSATWDALWINLSLALAITYLLMAGLFESWLYPFVIICSVLPGALGGILGLQLLNLFGTFQALDVLTMLGFFILIGTVVNNPILIVHQSLNHIREEGMNSRQAILESVRTRIRPIFMTTITTCLGLFPLVVFKGAGNELYRGLGSVVLGGLLISTVFTLVLTPTLFSLTMGVKEWIVGLLRPAGDEPPPDERPQEVPAPVLEERSVPVS